MCRQTLTVIWVLLSLFAFSSKTFAAELLVGTATTDITPSKPVAISGQFHLRLAGPTKTETPITASVLALESCQRGQSVDLAIMVSCDVCTDSFELFTEYGIRIKARSKALQTFVVQLVGPGTYLPTERAVRGGGYSAIVHSNLVGPEGGQVLVDRTVEAINAMWEK